MLRNGLVGALALALIGCGGGESNEASSAALADITTAELTGTALWAVDREASRLGFRASQNNKSFEGSFERWNAAIVLDPQSPETEGQINAQIDLLSVDAGNGERNDALPGKDWFHTAVHPVATFNSTSITSTGPGTYEADGTLTIKGITQDVVLAFSLEVTEDGRAIADGSVPLDRSDFNVGEGQFSTDEWVGFEVEVLLHIEATPAG